MAYRVTAKQVVVFVPIQQFIDGQQLRQEATVKHGLLLPNSVEPAVIETLLDNGLIQLDETADEFERLFRHAPPAPAEVADEYNKLFKEPYEPKAAGDPAGYSDFAKLLPPHAEDSTSRPDDDGSLTDDLFHAFKAVEPVMWRLRWAKRRARRKVA